MLPKGGGVPIRKVRLKKVLKAAPIGDEAKRRYVAESSNHHVAATSSYMLSNQSAATRPAPATMSARMISEPLSR